MRRIFLSIDLSNVIKDQIKTCFWYWRDDLLMDLPIKWTNPNNWHVTLVFFGDKTDEEIEIISEIIRLHKIEGDRLLVRGLDSFGRGKNTKVLFLEVLGRSLTEYVEVLRESLKVNDIEVDNQPYRGHVTIGRVKGVLTDEEVNLIDDVMNENKDKIWGKMNFTEVILYESRLSASGSTYISIDRFNNE